MRGGWLGWLGRNVLLYMSIRRRVLDMDIRRVYVGCVFCFGLYDEDEKIPIPLPPLDQVRKETWLVQQLADLGVLLQSFSFSWACGLRRGSARTVHQGSQSAIGPSELRHTAFRGPATAMKIWGRQTMPMRGVGVAGQRGMGMAERPCLFRAASPRSPPRAVVAACNLDRRGRRWKGPIHIEPPPAWWFCLGYPLSSVFRPRRWAAMSGASRQPLSA